MLVWTDLETTGLASQKDSILEIAAIATDDALNEVARFQRVVYYYHAARIVDLIAEGRPYHREPGTLGVSAIDEFVPVDAYVLEMHDKNGLWRDCVHGQILDTVDRDFAAWILANATTSETDATGKVRAVTPQLAGSTISFDRGFIAAHMPRTIGTLHYRSVDVSTLNETARRFWPELYDARPNNKDKAHRGMADIEESLRVYKHYLGRLHYFKTTAVFPNGNSVRQLTTAIDDPAVNWDRGQL